MTNKEQVQKKLDPSFFPRLWSLANDAGMLAVSKLDVTPMVVTERTNPMDDASPVRRSWYVGDGVCGFAWVTVRPGGCAFARWMKENKRCDIAYGGGMQFWVHYFNQCMQKKEAYAEAFAEVLRQFGIKAYSGSRMD